MLASSVALFCSASCRVSCPCRVARAVHVSEWVRRCLTGPCRCPPFDRRPPSGPASPSKTMTLARESEQPRKEIRCLEANGVHRPVLVLFYFSPCTSTHAHGEVASSGWRCASTRRTFQRDSRMYWRSFDKDRLGRRAMAPVWSRVESASGGWRLRVGDPVRSQTPRSQMTSRSHEQNAATRWIPQKRHFPSRRYQRWSRASEPAQHQMRRVGEMRTNQAR